MNNNDNQIVVGSTVVLKSGSPKMSVIKITTPLATPESPNPMAIATVAWHPYRSEGKMWREELPLECLTPMAHVYDDSKYLKDE